MSQIGAYLIVNTKWFTQVLYLTVYIILCLCGHLHNMTDNKNNLI